MLRMPRRVGQPRGFPTLLTLLLAAAAAIGLGTIAVVAQAISSRDKSGITEMTARPLATAVQPDQVEGFAVFARARTVRDEMPADAREQVGNSTKTGRNLNLSRAIDTPTGTGWAVPGNGTVCLVMPDPIDGYGITCSDTALALAHGLVGMLISSDTPDVANVTIVLPRNSRASATLDDGRDQALASDHYGVVSVRLQRARSITLTTPSGVRTTRMPVPPPTRPTQRDCGDGRITAATIGCSP